MTRITLETRIARPDGCFSIGQNPRALNDDLLARLNFGKEAQGLELTLTAYRSANDTLILAEGNGYIKRFVVRSTGELATGLSSQDQKTFEAALAFHEAKKSESNLAKMKNELQDWKNHKKEKIKELRCYGPHKDGLGNPINEAEAYKLLFSEMKDNLKALENNLKLDIKPADTRNFKLP